MKQKLSIFMGIIFFVAIITGLSLAEYNEELRNAYNWAYNYKITTQPTIEGANLEGDITRQSLSKMLVEFSETMLGKTPDYTLKCDFSDEEEITEDLRGYVKEACQLGLMGQGEDRFNPMGKVSVAQFGTILSRALWDDSYEGSDPFYLAHLVALQENGILDDISNPEETIIKRGTVITALMRSVNGVGYGLLGFGEYLDEINYNYNPEIESLMDLNKLTEKEKQVIRDYYDEIGGGFLNNIYSALDSIDVNFDDEGTDYLTKINKTIDQLTTLRGYFKDNILNIKKIYEALNVDLTDTTPYTPGEMVKKSDELSNKVLEIVDLTIELYNTLKEKCEDGYCDFEFDDESIHEKYDEEMDKLKEKYDRVSDEFEVMQEDYEDYLEEYKIANKYWRDYYDSLIDSYEVLYDPKDAVSISGYLVWEDLTRYQGDIKDGKMEGKGVLAFSKYYYSGDWENNKWNGFGELYNSDYTYTGYFRNYMLDGFGILRASDGSMIYTGEWLNGKMHGIGEYSTEDYYFSGTWKFNEFSYGKLILADGVTYEGGFRDNEYYGEGKLTLTSKDVYEGKFKYGEADGFGKITLKNGEVYSGEWNSGYLSGEGIYIKDGKVILSSKIDIIDNQWNNTIVITDGVDTLTMMNKNLGASEVGTGESSYGLLFKWGNNTAFNFLDTGDSKAFLNASTGEWNEKVQGPCPSGYHIPTVNEWEWIVDLWKLKKNTEYLNSGQVKELMNLFKLPAAGYRYGYKATDDYPLYSGDIEETKDKSYDNFSLRYNEDNMYYAGRFWTSTTYDNYYGLGTLGYMYYGFTIINHDAENDNYNELQSDRINEVAYPIRCFKD